MAMKSSNTWTKDESACEVLKASGQRRLSCTRRGQSCLQARSPESGGCHGNATSGVVEAIC